MAQDLTTAEAEILDECQDVIGYRFQQPELLRAALTHTSGANTRLASNERMEFLGDSVLGLVCCEQLYQRFPEYQEGDLTKVKSAVVSRRTCARISKKLHLGDFLFMGRGMHSQYDVPSNLLADVFESLVAAIYLDGGLDVAKNFILKYLMPEIEDAAGDGHGNYKSILQQLAQRQLGALVQRRAHEKNGLRDEAGERLSAESIVSANAYLGVEPIMDALAQGADVVITGRVADSSLFLAPLVHEHGWSADDWTRRARGAVAGHLLECAGQVTGGYFADPTFKDVPGLARLGFPIGEVDVDGAITVTKLNGTGGHVTVRTCTEQLLYEMHDPRAYLTPDVCVDISEATITELAPDRVRVEGVAGRERPAQLKVSVGHSDGCVGEGQISYAGPGAVARGRLALEIVAERLRLTKVQHDELRLDLIGVNALHGEELSAGVGEPYEVRARVAARCATLCDARKIGEEVEMLYTNGPAGGGGVAKATRELVGVTSTFVPRDEVHTAIEWEVA